MIRSLLVVLLATVQVQLVRGDATAASQCGSAYIAAITGQPLGTSTSCAALATYESCVDAAVADLDATSASPFLQGVEQAKQSQICSSSPETSPELSTNNGSITFLVGASKDVMIQQTAGASRSLFGLAKSVDTNKQMLTTKANSADVPTMVTTQVNMLVSDSSSQLGNTLANKANLSDVRTDAQISATAKSSVGEMLTDSSSTLATALAGKAAVSTVRTDPQITTLAKSAVDQVLNDPNSNLAKEIAGKAATGDVPTTLEIQSTVNNMVADVSSSIGVALATKTDTATFNANTDRVNTQLTDLTSNFNQALATKANTTALPAAVETNVNTLLATPSSQLASTLSQLANASDVYPMAETYSRDEVTVLLDTPRTQLNSPPCEATAVGLRRVHTTLRTSQLCLPYNNFYAWQGDGCAEGCAACNGGTCTVQVSKVEPDFLHLSFERTLIDSSPKNWPITLSGSSKLNVFDSNAAQGEWALNLDGADDYLQLPPMTVGGAFSVCVFVKFDDGAFNNWQRIFDFGNGAGDMNFLWVSKTTSTDSRFQYFYDGGDHTYDLPGYFNWARGAFMEACATISATGTINIYQNGRLVGTSASTNPLPVVARSMNYIGESNWQNDDFFKGSMDNLRMWNKELTPDDIWQGSCDMANSLDCKGLQLHLTFDQFNVDDRSPAHWVGSVSNVNAGDVWSRNGKDGGGLNLDGQDDHLQFVPRWMGGSLTICAWAYYDNFNGWGRVVDFGYPNGGKIILANVAATKDLRWTTVNSGGTGLTVANFWAGFEGQWGHVCATADAANNKLVAYSSGVELGSLVMPANSGTPWERRDYHYVGRSNWASDGYFDGVLDDFRIYDYALSATEVIAVAQLTS